MGLGISVHDTHVVNTVSTIMPEVTDQEVSLLFSGIWRCCVVPVSRTCGTVRHSLWILHCTTCKYEGVVAHMTGDECFSGQVYDPVPELVMTRHDKVAPLVIKGAKD